MLSDFEFNTLSLERVDDHVLVVSMDRPQARNAMNTRMGEEIKALFEALYVDAEGVRCAVLTGTGDRAFCAGGDLKERDGMSEAQWQRQHHIFEQAVLALRQCPVAVIAAVNGAAFGGGCELALACDFIYAAEGARFALTEVTLGIIPGAMGTQHLPHAVGERRAKEIVLTGRPFDAGEAHAFGMVNAVFAADVLREEVLHTARRIAANAPLATIQAKKAVGVATQVDRFTGYRFELEAYATLVDTHDRREGVRAFVEKRPPRFEGR